MFSFNKYYFGLTLLLFITEVLIALYAHDQIIRPYAGDFLIVIFLYCLIRTFLNAPARPVAISVLLFSYLLEASQYFNLIHHLNLDDSKIAPLILGNSFSWIDMLAYTLGICVILMLQSSPVVSPPIR
ncbi:ribosomal maturation YjgA family protein [Pedobacter sp. NJ-S-72]